MRTRSAFMIWTAMVLHLSVIKGQRTDPSSNVTSPLNEVIPEDHTTSKSDVLESRASTAYSSVSSPSTDASNDEVTPPSQSPEDAAAHNDSSPSPSVSRSPVTTRNTDTASLPGSSSSPSLPYLKSTISDSVATTVPATSISPSEGHQNVSVSQITQTAPPLTPTYPQTSPIALTNGSKVTGPVPLEDQNKPAELDVGDQESGKVTHRPTSPLDPLLAALVTIFIICTAMVSAVLFLRFRQRSEHPEFHRLQDLPMDDLLEDTPLSRYTY